LGKDCKRDEGGWEAYIEERTIDVENDWRRERESKREKRHLREAEKALSCE
jgi:hypothetical protein